MLVRELAQEDYSQWRQLWTAYLDFYEIKVAEDVYKTLWKRLHQDRPFEPFGLIAERDNRLVGLTHFVLQRHVWRRECVTYISDIFVDPTMRGERVGELLLKAVYVKADELGAPYVYWATDQDNHTARRLYDRCGYLTKSILYRRSANRL